MFWFWLCEKSQPLFVIFHPASTSRINAGAAVSKKAAFFTAY